MPRAGALVALAALAIGACHREAPMASCRDSLAGIWRVAGSAERGGPSAPVRRWALLDRGLRVEGYPLFDDTDAAALPPGADLIRSPRALALIRSHTSLVGHVERWVMRGARKCAVRASARIFDCRPGVLDDVAGGAAVDIVSVQLGVLDSPDDFTTCIAAPDPAAPSSGPAPPERWYREPGL